METVKTTKLVESTGQYYKDICWMAVPLLCMATYFYGLRPVLMCGAAVLAGRLCDRLVAWLGKRPYVEDDYSNESIAIIIALLLPATASWPVLITAVLAGVLIGKEAFGGYGSYPFSPAAVGFTIAAACWPKEVFRYPQTHTVVPLWDAADVATVNGISSTLKNGGLPIVDTFDLFLGDYAGPMGATAALVILSCALFLLVRGDIRLEVPLAFSAACMAVVLLFPRQADLLGTVLWETMPQRLVLARYELLSGANLFCTVFLINEPYLCPRNRVGRVVYGLLLGLVSMGFRYFGVYETGICFALLTVSSVSGWMDRIIARLSRQYRMKKRHGGETA